MSENTSLVIASTGYFLCLSLGSLNRSIDKASGALAIPSVPIEYDR